MQMFMPKLCTKSMDNISTIFAHEPQLIENTENLESCLETPKHVRSASEARVYDQQWLLYDSKIRKRGGSPKRLAVVTCSTRCRECRKQRQKQPKTAVKVPETCFVRVKS
jgi:hypothetical protein